MFYATEKLLNTASEANGVLYVGKFNLNKKRKKKERRRHGAKSHRAHKMKMAHLPGKQH